MTAGVPAAGVEAGVHVRGARELVWARLRRDRVAVGAGIVLAVVFLACFVGEPLLAWALGRGPD
ncbi:MAG TPA: hypothetical protein VIU86_10920, partial [Gaiellaceae bacterium]